MDADMQPEPGRAARLSPYCPRYRRAVEVIGRRWTGAILRALMAGRTRFNEIAQTVPGISDRLLSGRLRELESEGIVRRKVTDCRPVRIEYGLTPMGEALVPVVQSVAAWAEAWIDPAASYREEGEAGPMGGARARQAGRDCSSAAARPSLPRRSRYEAAARRLRRRRGARKRPV